MQQTRSYWRLVTVAGVVCAFVVGACTVTTSTDDDDTAGAGGAGTAGTGTSGAPAAGAGVAGSGVAGSGTSGTGGAAPVPFQCDPEEGGAQGTPNTCTPVDSSDECETCIQGNCCALFEACYATDPGNQCGWGGPAMVNGEPNNGGELACIKACLEKVVVDSGAAPEDSDVESCASNCATTVSNGATKECGSVIGNQTNDLVGCLRMNCSKPCFGAE
ncbi:MAG: hypothetical protein WDO69_22330 [Pseudomonadota bacterium]